MGVKIYLKPSEAWDFFTKNRERLAKEQVDVAVNTDTNISVCITEENGYPLFNVYRNDVKVDSEPAIRIDCEDTYKKLCFAYLFPLVVNTKDKKSTAPSKADIENDVHDNENYVVGGGVCLKTCGKKGPQDLEDEIYMRDDELEQAVWDALTVFLGKDNPEEFGFNEDVVSDIVGDVCEYLATYYGVSVYRPMWKDTEQDDQTLVYDEFPYDYLIDESQSSDDDPSAPI